MRTRVERRKINFNKIIHKKKLANSIYGFDFYKHDNQYSKGKIHYSCPCCSKKTNNKGKQRYGERRLYKHSDKQKIDSTKEQIKAFQLMNYI